MPEQPLYIWYPAMKGNYQIGTQPVKSSQPSLPANRAFVMQLHAEAKVEQGEFRGRVEHIASMQVTHFHSLEVLVAFIAKVVTSLQEDDTDEQC